MAPALRLPEWTLSFVTFIGIIGFPFALFFAWIFELTPEGIKRSEDVEPDESITANTGNNLNKVIITLLLVAVGILLADRFFGLSQRLPGLAFQPVTEAPAEEQPAADVSAETPEEDEGPRSVAVLPFVNMSDDKEQEYFSDGISEELLNALAQIRELRVAARTSSFAFKGQKQDITEIGDKLNVETVLEGSVRKSGARVRITAQLINVEDGYHLWSKTYDRDLTDIFAVQDEISAAIVDALKVHLTEAPEAKAGQQLDIAAYNFFLQARHNVRLRRRDTLELSLKQFQQALDIEPQYAAAWAGKALATSLLADDQYGEIPRADASRLAQGYLDIAFSIDPDIGVGHTAQALVHMDTDNCEAAIASIQRALDSLPSEGILYVWKSFCLKTMGEYSAADAALEQAFSIDPLHPAVRVNWIELRVYSGGAEEVRAMITPGTEEYYDAEWTIARYEGRWADMYRLLEEGGQRHGGVAFNRIKAFTLFFWLGEAKQALPLMPPAFARYYYAHRRPQQVLDDFAGRTPQSLSQLDRDVLLDALMETRDWEGVLQTVEHLLLELATDYGDVGARTGSAFSDAVALSIALNHLGESERATTLARRLRGEIDKTAARGLPYRDYGRFLAMLEFLLGNPEEAVAAWRKLYTSHWLSPATIIVFNPLRDEFAKREDFQALLTDLQQKLDTERKKLGWEPRALEDI